MYRFVVIFLTLSLLSCDSSSKKGESNLSADTFPKGALLTTSFNSFEDFKKVVDIEYSSKGTPWVRLTHSTNGGQVISLLESGVSEDDFMKAKQGGMLDKLKLGVTSPYFVSNRNDLLIVFFLSRRRHKDFGWEDQAFFDLAEAIQKNITKEDLAKASADELSEKGYINTFNHVVAQSLMTTLFSEQLADFVADSHERSNMPALITGDFTKEQLEDIKNGVVDNYVDIINNEWGQELGKILKQKYNITRDTKWTPELMANYLNEFQSYFSRVFKISFKPFKENDGLPTHYAKKINRLMNSVSGMW